jgi:hypothetical protein
MNSGPRNSSALQSIERHLREMAHIVNSMNGMWSNIPGPKILDDGSYRVF